MQYLCKVIITILITSILSWVVRLILLFLLQLKKINRVCFMYGLYWGYCSDCTDGIWINVHLLLVFYSDKNIMCRFYSF